jgi:class 3 adenylate cyclase
MARTETVTVVFTDLVGSTELASRLGHDAYEAMRHAHFTALRGAVTTHNGSEVKTTGDGLMLRFDSAASAIACAVSMQQATHGAGRGAGGDPVPSRRRLHWRSHRVFDRLAAELLNLRGGQA